MQTNLAITTIVIATVAVLAMIVPLDLMSHDSKMQGLGQANAEMADNSMAAPHHDMVAMMMGQDSMSSDQSNETQDNDAQNTSLSKTSDNVTVDFAATPMIQTNSLASIQMHVKDSKSGAKLSHVDWAITVRDPDGNLIYKTTTGHSHMGNMGFSVAFPKAGESTVYLTVSSIGTQMMGLEVEPKGRTHTMLSGSPKGFATDPTNDFGAREFEFPVYVQTIDQTHTLNGTVPGTAVNFEMSTMAKKIVAGQPVTFVFTATKAKDGSMITHPDTQVTVSTEGYVLAQSAAVEGAMTMNGAVHGHTGVMTVTEIFPSAGPYVLDVKLQPSPLSDYMWGQAYTDFNVFVSEPTGSVSSSATETSDNPPPNTVDINGLESPFFTPDVLNIKAGTTVTFVNTDGNTHTVTSVKPGTTDADGTFDSGLIKAGKTFTFTFNKPGTYQYICMIHTHMHGTIVVS
ncbi:MAG: cupredoxin domain-containing protein [Thaumarchaeota archaeon]|nr:cupredoxin domain-containing protein [Nitrososphaerota archaeon]